MLFANLKKMNELLTYGFLSDLLILAYIQFVTMLTELQSLLGQELKCLCSETVTVLTERTVPKTLDISLLHLYCIRNKQTYHTEMYV
jgi:hypothetical protein